MAEQCAFAQDAMQSVTIVKLLPSKDKVLLIRGYTFPVPVLDLHFVDRIGSFHIQNDGLTSGGL